VITKPDTIMWRRVQEVLTPNLAELSQAERDLADLGIPQEASKIPAANPRTKKPPMKFAALALAFSSLAWIGSDIVMQKPILELTNFEQALISIRSDADTELWRQSMVRISREVKMALHGLHHMAQEPTEATAVQVAARAALRRLRQATSADSGITTTCEINHTWEIATTPGLTISVKRQAVDDLEHLAAVGILAVRRATNSNADIHEAMVSKLDQWLLVQPRFSARNR
jgi:hypothetical protein